MGSRFGWRGGAAAAATALIAAAGVGSDAPRAQAARTVKQAMLDAPARDAYELGGLLTGGERRFARERPVYASGHIVVKFDSTATSTAMLAALAEIGGEAMHRPTWADFSYVRLAGGVDPLEAAAALQGRDGVVYAEPDALPYPDYTPNDPLYQYQWNLQRIGMDRAWDINRGGDSGVIVAVLDTGVAYASRGAFAQAPDLGATRFAPGFDFIWNDNEPFDTDGHGTHVSGTVAQSTNNSAGVAGMAFNATIMPVKVLLSDWDESAGAPFPFGSSTVSRGIRYAVDNGARVINMSLGAFGPNTATLDAIRYAVERGVFIAISAGNDGDGLNRASWPASYAPDFEGVMAVAALDYNLRASYYSTHRNYVEIAAPGGDIRADLNRDGFADGILQQTMDDNLSPQGVFNRFSYFFYQGTSMASPHVAGLAALLMDQGITSPRAIEAAIRQFADEAAPPGRDDFTGHGVINPRNTLRGLGLAK
jgi:serine protease